MRYLINRLLVVSLIAGMAFAGEIRSEGSSLEGKRIAVIVAEGFHDAEALVPVFHLQAYRAEPVLLSTGKGPIKAYNSEVVIDIAKTLAEVEAEEFDAVILPGGRAPAELRENRDVLRFMRAFAETGRPIAGICHGPQVMAAAGIIEGISVTSFRGIADELRQAGADYVDREVVVDGPFITSRLPGDLPAFNRAIVDALRD